MTAGAKFAGPVAEHHDGFSMWNTKHNTMNSYRMGPKRDVVGELSEAIRKKDMKYMVALHHAENYSFLKRVPGTDSMKPEFEEMFSKEGIWTREKFNHVWYSKLIELIDLYSPDLMWFDFGLRDIPDRYKRNYLSYYYNHALKNNKEVIVAYKNRDLVAEGGLLDLELGRFDDVMDFDWITDTTIDSRDAWGYMHGATYKSSEELIQYLVENVSKNGYLLLNVGPKPDGTFPDEVRPILHDMGKWLRVNGEGIYGSVPWYEAKEGPAKLEKSGPITDYESKIKYTQEDIRYTAKDNAIYAFIMARPSHKVTLNYILPHLSEGELESITMLGSDTPLHYQIDGKQLHVFMPDQMPEEPIYTLRILRRELPV